MLSIWSKSKENKFTSLELNTNKSFVLACLSSQLLKEDEQLFEQIYLKTTELYNKHISNFNYIQTKNIINYLSEIYNLGIISNLDIMSMMISLLKQCENIIDALKQIHNMSEQGILFN